MVFNNLFLSSAVGVFNDFHGKPWGWENTLTVTFAGFLIVFIVLIVLIIIFTVFGKVMKNVNERKGKEQPEKTSAPVKEASGVDEETAAVIVAALTKASGGKKLIIKSIKEADKK